MISSDCSTWQLEVTAANRELSDSASGWLELELTSLYGNRWTAPGPGPATYRRRAATVHSESAARP